MTTVRAFVADRGRHLRRELGVLAVVRAGHERHRHRQLRPAVPQRRLHALAERAQLVRDAIDRVGAPAFVDACDVARQRREQRLVEPAIEERVDAVALDVEREPFVGASARGRVRVRRRCPATRSRARAPPRGRVARARGRGTAARPSSSRRRCRARHARRCPTRSRGSRGPRAPRWRRRPTSRGKRVDHGVPRVGRLGEAVDEDHAHRRMIAPAGRAR